MLINGNGYAKFQKNGVYKIALINASVFLSHVISVDVKNINMKTNK